MKERTVSIVIAFLVIGVVFGLGIRFSRKGEPPVSSQAEVAGTKANASIISDTIAEAASEIDTSVITPSEPTESEGQVQPPEQPESKSAEVKPEEVKSEPISRPETKPEVSEPKEKKAGKEEKLKPEVKPAKIEAKAQPDIHFEELSHDFGEIGQEVQVTHIFKFKNVGDTDLHIEGTKAPCGCTAALLSSKIIAPGDTGEVKVTFSSGKFKGPQSKSVYVNSDDPDEAKVTLEITATVKPPITLEPDRLVFGKVKIGEKVSKEVEIKLEGQGELEIQRVETEVDYILAEILEQNSRGGKLKVTLGAKAPVGAVEKDIKIFTNHPQKPITELHVSARVQGRIGFSPEYLHLGPIYRGDPIAQDAIIYKRDESGLPLKVSAKSNLDFFQVKITTTEEGMRYKLNFSLTPKAPLGRFKTEIEIKTNDPDQPVITLPVVGDLLEKE